MEREFLQELGLADEAIDAVLARHGQEMDEAEARHGEELAQRDFDHALERALDGYGFTSHAARQAAAGAAREAGLTLGQDGSLEGLEEVMDDLRERDPGAFVSEKPTVIFTAAVTDGGPVTREQIISIPDRALRRAAIAENIQLFKGEN